jgi:hypothetical protein
MHAAAVVCIVLLLGYSSTSTSTAARIMRRATRGPTRLSPSPLLPVLSLTLPPSSGLYRYEWCIITSLASRPIPLTKSHSITPPETTKYLTILRGQHPSWRAPYIVGIAYGDTKKH